MPRSEIGGNNSTATRATAATGDNKSTIIKIAVAVLLFAGAAAAFYFMNNRPLTVEEPAASAGPAGTAPAPTKEASRPLIEMPEKLRDTPTGGPRVNPDYVPPK